MRRAYAVAAVGVLLVSSACVSLSRTREGPTPTGRNVYGSELSTPVDATATPTTAPDRRPSAARFVLRLNDQNGRHPDGIPVRISGPVTKTVTTDRDGEVKFNGPGGVYRFAVVYGCHATLDVTSGGSARVGIVEDTPSRGELPVTWQHRFAPGPPVFAPATAWPEGERIEIRYSVNDRCTDDPKPEATYSTYRFKPSSNVRIVETPVLRADREGEGRVVATCAGEGDISLMVVDQKNPSDSRDLLALSGGHPGERRCSG